MPNRIQLTEAEREQRRAADRAFVQQAVDVLRSSEGWQRWLNTRRHFHSYSLLISRTGVIDRVQWGCGRRRHVAAAGRSRCRDESRFCLRAGGSRPWPHTYSRRAGLRTA
jgi:hypothetical protein